MNSALIESCNEIGQRVGRSGGYVRQIAHLQSEIVSFLKALHGKDDLKTFSNRRLRTIALLPPDQQLEAFQDQFGTELRA